MKDQVEANTGYFDADACDIDAFKLLIEQNLDRTTVPNADDVLHNTPIYDMSRLRPALEDHASRRAIMTEWAQGLRNGAGIVVLQSAYADTTAIDAATEIYDGIIAAEKDQNDGADHFAASGANNRIWNSLQKLCEAAPEVFLNYFANTSIAAVCEAWLGPNYQMSAQINLVHPGGGAQQAHRDYHLGFQTADISAAYPAHVHDLSPVLTLQGAIAHVDMPIESGPTKLLPFSQAYRPGYAAWRRDDFRELFEGRFIQIPLSKGDAVFFNPALFHAAGANTTSDVHRMANLLQVSSAFGRAMENIDRRKMCKLLYPHAADALRDKSLSRSDLSAALAASAEGYSFPTNLDRDPPVGGLAPETQQAFFHRALSEGLSLDDFAEHLNVMHGRQMS